MNNYLSYAEADELCDGMIRQYIGKDAPIPAFIDIDGFVMDFLHCRIIYETFAEDDPDKVGFTGDGKTPLRVRRNSMVGTIVLPPNTVVLERVLLRPEEEKRRRFVLGHEAGHIIANRINPDTPKNHACFHRVFDAEREYEASELAELYHISEWQANTFSAGLLMPRFLMRDKLSRFNGGRRIPVYGDAVFHPREKVILNKMADSLNVSYTALTIRLKRLGMLKHHDISEYITKELQLGGDRR